MTIRLARISLALIIVFVIVYLFNSSNKVNIIQDEFITISQSDIEDLYNDIHCTNQYLLQQISTDTILHDSGSLEYRIKVSIELLESSVNKLDSIYLSY